MRIPTIVVVLTCVSLGCRDREGVRPISLPPLAPSMVPAPPAPPPAPNPGTPVLFTDPASGFKTADVFDAQDQIVRFTYDELVWVADGTRFPEFLPDGNFIGYHHAVDHVFQIQFGRKDGRQGAYLTGIGKATVLDLWIDERGDLKVAETDVPVPGT